MLVSVESSVSKYTKSPPNAIQGLVPTGAADGSRSLYRWPLRGRSGHALGHHSAEVSPCPGLGVPSLPPARRLLSCSRRGRAEHRTQRLQGADARLQPPAPRQAVATHRCLPLAIPDGLQPRCGGTGSSPCTPEKASAVRERMDWASSDTQRNSRVSEPGEEVLWFFSAENSSKLLAKTDGSENPLQRVT